MCLLKKTVSSEYFGHIFSPKPGIILYNISVYISAIAVMSQIQNFAKNKLNYSLFERRHNINNRAIWWNLIWPKILIKQKERKFSVRVTCTEIQFNHKNTMWLITRWTVKKKNIWKKIIFLPVKNQIKLTKKYRFVARETYNLYNSFTIISAYNSKEHAEQTHLIRRHCTELYFTRNIPGARW